MDASATAVEITRAVNTRQTSARDVCEEFLARIDRHDSAFQAFLAVDRDRARRQADDVDRRVTAGERLPLAGVPVAVKDNICTRGLTTTAGSRMLERFVPPYDATVITRLAATGAVVLGKTNCDEFAMGSSTENSAFGPTRNPWATDRTPGGSSGGSAAAVAARFAPVALGSDTGGSVRQPAAHCGVVGLRPTYGRVSRYGLIAFASSLDQIGPITRTAADAALVLSATAGPDPADATSSLSPALDARLDAGIEGLRVGVPRHVLSEGIAGATRERFEAALEELATRGAVIADLVLPHARYAIPVYYLIATAEASANLARYDGVRFGLRSDGDTASLGDMYARTRRDGFGLEVKRRIMLGTFALSAGYREAYYEQAQRVRTLIHGDYVRALDTVDVIATPTAPTPAFRLGEKTHDPLAMYMEDVLTVGASLAGLPAISVPCGFSPEGLPIGLQLTGAAFEEGTLLRVAAAYQRQTRWHMAEPPEPSAPQGLT
jgi:aspartyl-tRNA(Asn)/glutamyl-tRNA(Gln) amidotransferase subunit A